MLDIVRIIALATQRGPMVVTLENILDPGNMSLAMQRVIANKGSAGVDGMDVSQLEEFMNRFHSVLSYSILRGNYTPRPVRRVFIPKDTPGEVRGLGIPTVIDRLVQQAIAQVLSEFYEPLFSDSSHGFRPNRGCYTALDQCLEHANNGLRWIVDVDLRKFFDTVNHDKLMQVLSEQIKDGRVISLISKFLRAPVREKGKDIVNTAGTPQGGPVSPVLANIILNELDKELEKRQHKFVRYADDLMIFCGSKAAAERTLESIRGYIEGKLFLKVNESKTKVCYITSGLKYLGFCFYFKRYKKQTIISIAPHAKTKAKLKLALRRLTGRSSGKAMDIIRRKLKTYANGWIAYFAKGEMSMFIKEIGGWLRRRIRQIYWKQWKRVRTRYKMLRYLKVSHSQAYQWANTRLSYWRVAGSWILHTTLTNLFLLKEGGICPEALYMRRREKLYG